VKRLREHGKSVGFQKGDAFWLGRKRPGLSEKYKGSGNPMHGRCITKETRTKMAEAKSGKNHPNWKGGICDNRKEYVKKAYQAWVEKNRVYKNFLTSRRRARKRMAEGSHTFGEWELLKEQCGYICPACGIEEPEIMLGEDHIVPLIKGGSDYIENIQPLCRSCNSIKHTNIIKYG